MATDNNPMGTFTTNANFHTESQLITQDLASFKQNLTILQKELTQLQSASFGAGAGSSVETGQSKAKEKIQYLQSLAEGIKTRLTRLAVNTKYEKSIRERLMNEFGDLLNAFQQGQRQLTQLTRDQVNTIRREQQQHQQTLIFIDQDDYNNEEEINSQFLHSSSRSGGGPGRVGDFSRQQQQITATDNTELLEREETIHQLESDISNINTIFKELAQLVHTQGDVIDSIEANIEQSSLQVTAGTQQLSNASRYQTSARKKQLFLFLAMAIVLIVIILIVVYT